MKKKLKEKNKTMKKVTVKPFFFFIGVFVFCLNGMLCFAESAKYDIYAPLTQGERTTAPKLRDIAAQLNLLPFKIIKLPITKTIYYIQKYNIDKKAKWIYDTFKENGATLHFGAVNFDRRSYGVDLDMIQVARAKERYPNLVVDGWVKYSNDVYFQAGTEIGAKRILESGFKASGLFQYEDRGEGRFFGIGSNTSAGDGSSFKLEKTTLAFLLGYEINPIWDIDTEFSYQNNNISKGENKGMNNTEDYFGSENLVGINGDEILYFEIKIARDTRDHKDDPTEGSYQLGSVSFNEGISGSDVRYFKYTIDTAKYFSLGSPRRVLAIRFYGEHNDGINNGKVPFYDLAKLGGYGVLPRLSQTLRGFTFNRFFGENSALINIEYRYTIWEYRDFKLDAAIFFDEGQVFNKFSKFQFKNFRESYGVEFRTTIAHMSLINLAIAHGDEGTQLYIKTKVAF